MKKVLLAFAIIVLLAGSRMVVFGQTTADLQSQIEALLNQVFKLQLQLTAAGGTSVVPTPCTFTRTLLVGVEGEDVKCLQQYLNASGFIVAESGAGSKGQESTYFGLKTKQAVIAWQTSKSVKPMSGIFGPLSQAQYKILSIFTPPPPPAVDPAPQPPAPAPPPPPTAQPTCYERLVPTAYPTIQAAIDAACEGDAVVIAPGTYSEGVSITKNNLTVKSGAGTVTLAPLDRPAIVLDPFIKVFTAENLTLAMDNLHEGVQALPLTPEKITLKGLVIKNASTGIILGGGSGTFTVERSVILDSNSLGIHDRVVGDGSVLITQNTFSENDIGYYLDTSSGKHTLVNNTITNSDTVGVAVSSTGTNVEYTILGISYTNVWGSATNNYYSYRNASVFTPYGSGDMSVNPGFISSADYHLDQSSPLINAGDPAAPTDPDGSRADIGAYPFSA